MVKQKRGVRLIFIRMFTNFGRELVFSADLCYNDMGDENGQGKRIAEKKTNKAKKF